MTPPIERRSSDSPRDSKIQTSLTACWKDGVTAQVMIGIIDNFTIPLALLLGANNQEIGFLVAVPNLLSSLSQFLAVAAVDKAGSRLRLILQGVLLQAFFLLPIGGLIFSRVPHKLAILTGLIAVYKIIGSIIGPAWGSLVSEYLPAHRRGDYFGWRSRVMGITALLNLLFWGVFLYAWKNFASQESGFLILFLACAAARFISLIFIAQMADLPLERSQESEFTFWMFLRRFKESNFVKFVFYVSGITFATHLAAPYFSVHMLRDLHFDYISYMAITLASTLTSLIAFPIWGRHADVVGNARILKITSFFIPIIPILWVFTHHVALLIVIELFSGFVWGGFNLCAVNFIFDAVSPAKRMRCLGYFNVINGLAIFFGAALGGWLSDHLMPVFGYPLLGIFLVSAAFRLAAHFFLSEQFQEVRSGTPKVSSVQLFFSVVGIHPILGQNVDIAPLTTDVSYGPGSGRVNK